MQSEKVMNSYSFLQKCYKSLLFLAKKRYELLLFLTKKCMNCYSFLQKGYTSLLFLAKNVWIVTFSCEKSMNCYQYFFIQKMVWIVTLSFKNVTHPYFFLRKMYELLLFLAKKGMNCYFFLGKGWKLSCKLESQISPEDSFKMSLGLKKFH